MMCSKFMKKKIKRMARRLEAFLSFSKEDYDKIKERENLVPFEKFLENIAISVVENKGDMQDAVYIAEDAFYLLNPEK